MQKERINAFRETSKTFVDELGSLLIDVFHYLALFVIGASVVWSAVVAYAGIYFKTNMMPVRCLIFIAITALSRLLISDIQAHHQADTGILLISGLILLLALSTLVIGKPFNN